MKKSLVLAMAMALGVTASAYAANPFSDVPAGHWAYDSVNKLAAAGIVDGYGNGTFGGDRLMTRYEMAQIVAKAMAKGANVDRLAAEFADELDSLGVRVAALEKKSDNVKITGEFRALYANHEGKGSISNDYESTLRSRIWITGQIKALHENGVPYRDMTVLYRAHYVTRAVEEVLLGEKIPYTIYSGVQFFDRMEIKDALSYLRMIAYKDDLSFRRIVNVPKRNLGKRRMAFLQEYAERQGRSLYQALQDNLEDPLFKGTGAGRFVGLIESFAAGYGGRPVSEVLSALLNESGYEKMLRTEGSQERLDNLAELKQSVYEYETTCGEEVTLEHYLAHVALFTNADTAEQGDKVRLMTVHAAKGLEFPYVFLCGMNEGIFPSRKVRTQQAMEEERRLAFVALTRAEKGLYISEADGRNFDGTPRYPSRFLLDIDRNLLAFTRPPEEGLIRAARDYIGHSQTYLPETDGNMAFSVGQRVKHILFGSGTVLDVDMDKGAHVVQFDEMETPRKISFRAKLERI